MKAQSFAELWIDKRRSTTLLAAILVGLTAGAAGMYGVNRMWVSHGEQTTPQGESSLAEENGQDEAESSTVVTLSKEKWGVADLHVQPVSQQTMSGTAWMTGKLALNEDHLAHIYSLADGRVHEVLVQFGDDVKKDDVLVVIDSKEVGILKLGLFQHRLDAKFAKVDNDWNQNINNNTRDLIRSLEQGVSITDIDRLFGDKPMGDYRGQLLSAYANLYKSEADFERLKSLASRNVVAGKQLITAKANFEADQAMFLALQEQLRFTAWQRALVSEQKLKRAEQAIAVSKSQLYILGYREEKLSEINLDTESENISHYELRAPFDGTVIGKNVVLSERVGPNTEMLQIADLSTLWVQADIYQKDLPKLERLGETLHFRAPDSDHVHTAKIFYTGDVLDPTTRTARLRAIVENPLRHLKPGMFVEVALPGESIADAITVPASTLQEIEGEDVVFVQIGAEEFEKRNVTVGARSDGIVQIRAGLRLDDKVVTTGGFALKSELMKEFMSED